MGRKVPRRLAGFLTAVLLLAPAAPAAPEPPAPRVRTKAVRLGQPGLDRWPASDPTNALARSVWDMHVYRKRLYLACGDLYANKGPVPVYALGPRGFEAEYTAPDEQLAVIREAGDALVIPAGDPREGWEFGNLYVKDPQRGGSGRWRELRTIPGALHVLDFLSFGKSWFVWHTTKSGTAPALRSRDRGETWEPLLEAGGWFLPFPGFFLVVGPAEVRRCDGEKTEAVFLDLFPGDSRRTVGRYASVGDRVVYSPATPLAFVHAPVYVLSASDVSDGAVARTVEEFRGERVRDIVARDGICHVMAAERIAGDTERYRCTVRSSPDLALWTLSADVTLPGLPWSFEVLDGRFCVGLGVRNAATSGIEAVGPESGTVYRIE